MTEECNYCRYFNPKDSLPEGTGECAVNPPIIVSITEKIKGGENRLKPTSFYPVVAIDQPCCRFFSPVAKPTIGPKTAIAPDLMD